MVEIAAAGLRIERIDGPPHPETGVPLSIVLTLSSTGLDRTNAHL